MTESLLERIIQTGNRGPYFYFESTGSNSNIIRCADGFKVSVIAGWMTHCRPRPGRDVPLHYPGPYTHVEVGFPSSRPEPWDQWQAHCEDPDDPTGTVYGRVPVDLVRELVAAHGGEAAA